MALTFDEFGMWLHLGGSYWQRASLDAVVVVGAFFALIAFAPSLKPLESRHIWAFVAVLVALALFGTAVAITGHRIGSVVGPQLRDLEFNASP